MKEDNKFSNFYVNVKEKLIESNILEKEKIIGMPTQLLEGILKDFGIKIPLAIQKYYEFFGDKFILGTAFSSPYKNFMDAQLNLTPQISNFVNETVPDALFFEYDFDRFNFYFCSKCTENPMPYLLQEFDEIIQPNFYSFTNLIRNRFFFKMISYFRENEIGNLQTTMQWLEFHFDSLTVNYRIKNKLSDKSLIENRWDFYKLVAIEEAEGDFLYSIDEFEMKFIEYLKSKIGDI